MIAEGCLDPSLWLMMVRISKWQTEGSNSDVAGSVSDIHGRWCHVCLRWVIWRHLLCSRGPRCTPCWPPPCWMRPNGNTPTPFILHTFWTRRGGFSSQTLSFPFQQVDEWNLLIIPPAGRDLKWNAALLQVAGLVLERVWPEWNSSSSWPPSSSTSASLLVQEFPQRSSMWIHQRASLTCPPPSVSAQFPVCNVTDLNVYFIFIASSRIKCTTALGPSQSSAG